MAQVDCPCGRQKIDEREKICPYCGQLVASFSGTRVLSGEDSKPDTVGRWGTARFNTRTNLVLTVRDRGQTFVYDFNTVTRIVVGRADPDTGERPHIDLTDLGGIDAGVSRKHAVITRRDTGSLLLTDLEAPNGTFLNGQRLIAHQPRIIRDGDELRFGRLVVLVRFDKEAY